MDRALDSYQNVWGSIPSSDHVHKCRANFSFHVAYAYPSTVMGTWWNVKLCWSGSNKLHTCMKHALYPPPGICEICSSVCYDRKGNG